MTAEALALTPGPIEIGLTPSLQRPHFNRPNHAQIPLHLISATGELGVERGDFVEKRVQKLIETQPDVIEVIRSEKDSIEDANKHDLTVKINGGSPVDTVFIQVKSSRHGIVNFKREIRDLLFSQGKIIKDEEKMDAVKLWLTEQRIILINGSQTKTDEEIIKDSFLPQLERIQTNERNSNPIEIFPNFKGGE